MYKNIAAALILTCATTVAQASELRGSIDSQAVSSSDWSGFYVGAGVSHGAYEDRDERLEPFFPGFVSSGSDLGLSVHGGYNLQFDKIVFGVEADFTHLNSTFRVLPPGFSNLRINNVMSLRGRLGYDLGRFLPYATAGLGYATTNIAGLEDSTGWVAGAGVDYKVTDNLLFGVLYQYHRYEDFAGEPVLAEFDQFSARLSAKF